MWLRRVVGVCMIMAFVGMNAIVLVGILSPPKKKSTAGAPPPQVAVVPLPTVTITAEPGAISAGTSGGLKWTTTDAATCTASGGWSGQKTPFGAESTGRLSAVGNVAYTLTCTNPTGEAKATATVSVGGAKPPAGSTAKSSSSSSTASGGATYCGGRLPCYGPKDVASHGGGGNCWGWNGDRVINISGFDAAYHQAKSGIGSIEVSAVCGKDLAPSIGGSVSADGQTRNHNATTKSNADKNEIPYFVGYFDAKKP